MRFVLIALALGLAGCVTEQGHAQLSQFVETIRREPVPESSPLYQSVIIGQISGGRLGDASYNSVARDQDLQRALNTVLTHRQMLAPGQARYRLDARILRSSYPPLAMSTIEVTTQVDYRLVDTSNGATVFHSTVEARESTPMSSTPMFAARVGLSTVQSLTENVTMGIDQIVAASDGGQLVATSN